MLKVAACLNVGSCGGEDPNLNIQVQKGHHISMLVEGNGGGPIPKWFFLLLMGKHVISYRGGVFSSESLLRITGTVGRCVEHLGVCYHTRMLVEGGGGDPSLNIYVGKLPCINIAYWGWWEHKCECLNIKSHHG